MNLNHKEWKLSPHVSVFYHDGLSHSFNRLVQRNNSKIGYYFIDRYKNKSGYISDSAVETKFFLNQNNYLI